MIRFRFAVMLVVVLACAPAWADELKTITGKSVTGTLEKITANEIILQSAGKPLSTPLAQVLDLNVRPGRTTPAAERYIEVQLLDGSLLRCTKVTYGVTETKLELTSGISVKVPVAALYTVLRNAQDAKLRTRWEKLLKDKQTRDRIFTLADGDLNPIKGVLGAIDEAKQTIKFKPEVLKEIEPSLDKLQGLQFVRTDVAAEVSLCKVYDVDGNLLVASKLTYDAGVVQITTPFGHKVGLDYKAVARLDFNFGRLTYLSDLEEKVSDAVFLGGFKPFRKDKNLDGNPLMLQDKIYDKGLSIYAGAELDYNLAGKYKEFKAIVGADARIAEEGQGKVTVTIYCDRVKQKEYVVSTKESIPLAINVKDVTNLRIVVNGSNFTGYSGHATLANAHVSQ